MVHSEQADKMGAFDEDLKGDFIGLYPSIHFDRLNGRVENFLLLNYQPIHITHTQVPKLISNEYQGPFFQTAHVVEIGQALDFGLMILERRFV